MTITAMPSNTTQKLKHQQTHFKLMPLDDKYGPPRNSPVDSVTIHFFQVKKNHAVVSIVQHTMPKCKENKSFKLMFYGPFAHYLS